MKRTIILSLMVVLITSALVISGAYAWKSLTRTYLTPEQTVSKFYDQWVGYDGNPLVDKVYQDSDYLTPDFKQEINDIIASFDKGGFDPILCAQDIPSKIEMGNVTEQGDKASVIVKQYFSGSERNIIVELNKQTNQWLINNIVCEEGQSQSDLNNTVSSSVQNMVGEYIREHITELSPKPAVLGGSFYVTSIQFTDPYKGVVNYEDGHIALTANFEFSLPAAEQVSITEFSLSEKNEDKVSFNKIGNIVSRDDSWQLVYEKPGQPALTVSLTFDQQSKCRDQYEDHSCEPIYWQSGDRAEISGYIKNNKVIVTELKIVGEASKSISSDNEENNLPGSICVDQCGDGICQEIVCMGQDCPCAEGVVSCPQDCR